MVDTGYKFEDAIRKVLIKQFPDLLIHRVRQGRFVSQPCDILTLGRISSIIECKSKDISKRKTLKLESLFREGQLERQLEYLELDQLQGYLALELRKGRGHSNRAFLIPLEQVKGTKIDVENPQIGKEVEREGSEYTFIPLEED